MNAHLQEIWTLITTDKKKATILGALALVAGGLWLRAAMTSGPSTAKANEKRMTADGERRAKRASKKSESETEHDAPVRIIELSPPPPLTRDLFALSDALLASSAQTDPAPFSNPKSASGTDDKSLQSAGMRTQSTEDRVRAEAGKLRLRSTMIGANPIAVIEAGASSRAAGRVVRLGDEIEGFIVRAIHAREIELEKEGVRVTLTRAQ